MIYHVIANGEDIYNPEVDDLLLLDPTLELELNHAGSFSFTLPPSNRHYNSIKKMTTEISVYQDNELLFIGRAISDTPDFYNRKKIECEGALAYLNDSIQRPKKYTDLTPRQYLSELIEIHNAQVDEFKQFTVGKVTVNDTENLYRYTNYNNTLTEIKEDLIDNYGGYLFVRVVNGVKYLDYLAELPYTCDQTIQFGENLLDFTRNYDATQIATAIIPLGKDLSQEASEDGTEVDNSLVNRVTIADVNNGVDFVYNKEAVSVYGWIFKTQTWDDVTDKKILKTKGENYLKSVQWENLSIEAKAVDLHFIDGKKDRFRIGSEIRVVSEPHGMDTNLPLTKLTLNLSNVADNTITLGNDYSVPISAQSAALDRKQKKSAAQIAADIRMAGASEKSARREAIENATALITGNQGGHVVFHYSKNSDGSIKALEEILIMDTDQMSTAKKVWRWNLNGLGYSKNGVDGPYEIAATQDGAIVANRIITGILGDKAHKNFWNMETGEFSLSAYSTTEESEKYADGKASDAQSAAEKAAAKNTEDAINNYDINLSQEKVFNRLTNGGKANGIYMVGGDLYINADLIKSGTINGIDIVGSSFLSTDKSPSESFYRQLEIDRSFFGLFSDTENLSHPSYNTASRPRVRIGNSVEDNGYIDLFDGNSKNSKEGEFYRGVCGDNGLHCNINPAGMNFTANGNYCGFIGQNGNSPTLNIISDIGDGIHIGQYTDANHRNYIYRLAVREDGNLEMLGCKVETWTWTFPDGQKIQYYKWV